MNTISYFEIQSSFPNREVAFYSAVFGWKFTRDENIPLEYFRIETPTINGGLLKRPAPIPPEGMGTNAFTNSIQVENFDITANLILGNGGSVVVEKFAIPGKCWQGYFMDADNNTFGIFEVDAEAR